MDSRGAREEGAQAVWLRRWRRWAWLAACNLAGAGLGLAALLVASEVWLRLTLPFPGRGEPGALFVPGVGFVYQPGEEYRHTNYEDFWTIQEVNSLGFLDREPPDAALAAAACHVAVIGDSFVEAKEVVVADKLHARLEALAAERLPELGIVTSAFGRSHTGQVAQLAYYDQYVRRLVPKLVVLVFHENDFEDNFAPLAALRTNMSPDWASTLTAVRDGQGAFYLRQPSPEGPHLERVRGRRWTFLGLASDDGDSLLERALYRAAGPIWTLRWLGHKGLLESRPFRDVVQETLAQSPQVAAGWTDLSWVATLGREHEMLYARPELPPVLAAGLDYTAFALAEFEARARRDGFALVVLATEHVGGADAPMFQRLERQTLAAQIDLVDLHEYIVGQGGRLADAHWSEDRHWNVRGHQWAAEALFGYLSDNQDVCAGGEPAGGAAGLPRVQAPATARRGL